VDDYRPSSIVVSLCKKLHTVPIAESDRLKIDGRLVIVVADGRKLSFTKDDITRTLTEPDPAMPETASVDQLVGAHHPQDTLRYDAPVRKPRKKKEQHAE
jgi:hypothetical protein